MANAAVWIALVLISQRYPPLLSFGILAYTFGLRHAVDADHIAAIDNSTRKLIQQGERPVTVGFFFSLGHSTVVFLLSLGIVLASGAVRTHLPFLQQWGSVIGTVVSALFLYIIAALNLVSVRQLARQRGTTDSATVENILNKRGLINRLVGRLTRMVNRPAHMYPIGFLFGLGFDTASEVALLGLSSVAAGSSMPAAYVLLLPLLFAAGMSLIDTADGVLMLYAYRWAFLNPVRRLSYNLTVTSVSVFVALGVGTVEWLQVISSSGSLRGRMWTLLQNLDFGTIGYSIIAALIAVWLAFLIGLRIRRRQGTCE